jgi:hypothetical protein
MDTLLINPRSIQPLVAPGVPIIMRANVTAWK